MELDRRTILGAGTGLLTGIYPSLAPALTVQSTEREPGLLSGTRRSFTPGQMWLDIEGKPIQAHGGSVIRVGETYYWYGENKGHTNGREGVWHWGASCYASKDLYNWQNLGSIIPPVLDDPASPLHPKKGMDRPHILYNASTRMFVCWLKIMDFQDGTRTRTILTAPAITGPWKIVRTGLKPLGMKAGDFDLTLNPADGKAYMIFERMHSEIICADLNDDYTDLTGYYSTHLPRPAPPAVREAPAWFARRGKQYLATSGTTGYFPNPAEIASADTFHGPWTTLGLLHRGDPENVSFDSQICSVFRHPDKKDLYIALADRWTAGVPRAQWRAAKEFYRKLALPDRPRSTAEDLAAYQAVNMYKLATSEARYVWLPIRFEGDRPFIMWRDEWTIDEFD